MGAAYAPRVSNGLGHVPVLPREVLGVLSPREGETYVDCTAGLGGHASLVAPLVGASGRIVLNDVDDGNLGKAAEAVRRVGGARCPEIVTIRGNFAELPHALGERGIRADMVLADLGFSSNQVDDPARGLSFRLDGPLDMRLDPGLKLSAADLVNRLPEAELARILRDYGEERHAGLVARKLVQARKETPILTTARLAEVVRSVLDAAEHLSGQKVRSRAEAEAAAKAAQLGEKTKSTSPRQPSPTRAGTTAGGKTFTNAWELDTAFAKNEIDATTYRRLRGNLQYT